VIAGQVDAIDRETAVQRLGEFEIVAAGRSVEGEIAGVDNEVRARRVDMFAEALKILDKRCQAAGEMGIGNLGQAEFAHVTVLPAGS
jgi:hypothetical protein